MGILAARPCAIASTIIFSILQEAIAISPNNKYSRVILYVLDCDHLNPLHLIFYLSLFGL